MKKIISLLLALSLLLLSFSLVGCGEAGNGGAEDNGGETGGENGGNEGGGSIPSPMLDLIKDKVASFSIVTDQKDAAINDTVDEWIAKLSEYGIETSHYADYSANKMQDCEILIGSNLLNREKYAVDTHAFGEKGYVIRVVDEKVVICGGNTESTVAAMTLFLEEYIGINIATIDVTDVSISRTLEVLKVQDDYPFSAITVKGVNIKDMYIAADVDNEYTLAAAQLLQGALYSYSGAWIPIAKSDDEAKKGTSINVNIVEEAGEDGFEVLVESGELSFNCAFCNAFPKGMSAFIAEEIVSAAETLNTDVLNFGDSYRYSTSVSVVRYSEFGAKGSGSVDDFDAIIKTHEYANVGGQRVEADKGATYYIRENFKTAIIKTDVDWGDAQFIIDDREILSDPESRGHWVFKVVSDKHSGALQVPAGYSLKKTDTNIGLTFESKVMLHIVNHEKKVYIRNGANENSGVSQQEILIVEPNGDLDPLTPLIFDYDTVNAITVYPIDDEPLLIQGGVFTTWSNQQLSASAYYARGLYVQRSNTTVYNVTHLIDKEPTTESGACPYSGFFYVADSNNVTFDSCVMTGHRLYYTDQADGDHSQQGTYDIGAVRSNAITWRECTQSNDINDNTYWGVMSSNFCKNLTFDHCTLSRFDAHQGVHNITITDSTVGQMINLLGSGTAIIRNTTRSGTASSYFLRLREDYGSTWDGDLIIENCKFIVKDTATKIYMIKADWREHYFGYDCHIPNLSVDGFTVEYENGKLYNATFHIFKDFASSSSDIRENPTNPLKMPKTVTLKNISNRYELIGNIDEKLFSNTEVIKITSKE